MLKKPKIKSMNPIENSYNCDKTLQYNIPKGVKDSKKVKEKDVFGKRKCPRGHKVCKCK